MAPITSGGLSKKLLAEEIEKEEQLKRFIRRRRNKMRKLKQIYIKQAQARAVELRKKMRASSWVQGHSW